MVAHRLGATYPDVGSDEHGTDRAAQLGVESGELRSKSGEWDAECGVPPQWGHSHSLLSTLHSPHSTLHTQLPTERRGRSHRGSLPAIGGLFSVALSLSSRTVGVTHHRVLWSPDFPPRLRSRAAAAITRPTPARLFYTGGKGETTTFGPHPVIRNGRALGNADILRQRCPYSRGMLRIPRGEPAARTFTPAVYGIQSVHFRRLNAERSATLTASDDRPAVEGAWGVSRLSPERPRVWRRRWRARPGAFS